jgi:hypothetical protein
MVQGFYTALYVLNRLKYTCEVLYSQKLKSQQYDGHKTLRTFALPL